MATKLEEVQLKSGEIIYIEVYEVAGGRKRVATGKKLKKKFDEAWTHIRPAVSVVMDQMKALKPQEFEVKFGVKITGEITAIIAGASGEANFEITLKWKNSETAK